MPNKPSPLKSFTFESVVLRSETGLRHHFIPIPDDVAAYFAKQKTRRVIVECKGKQIRRAINGVKDGHRMIILSGDLLRTFKLALNDLCRVTLGADPAPEDLDIPEEFTAVMDIEPEAAKRFEEMTIGRKRSLLQYVTSAKTTETRIKRSLVLAEKLRTNRLYDDLQEKKKPDSE